MIQSIHTTGLRQRHAEARVDGSRREGILRERESERKEALRVAKMQIIEENVLLREMRDSAVRTGEQLAARIRDGEEVLGAVGETDAQRDVRTKGLVARGILVENFSQTEYRELMSHIRERMADDRERLALLESDLYLLNDALEESDAFMAQRVAQLEEMIQDIVEGREVRERLAMVTDMKKQQFAREEMLQELRDAAERRNAHQNGESPAEVERRQRKQAAPLAMTGARIDAINLLATARDQLSMKALADDVTLAQGERLSAQVTRLNNAIANKLDHAYANEEGQTARLLSTLPQPDERTQEEREEEGSAFDVLT